MKTHMAQRTVYSIDENVLHRFNRLVPVRKRSELIQTLMNQHIARNESAIERAARLIEGDPDYQPITADTEAMAFETLARMEHHE